MAVFGCVQINWVRFFFNLLLLGWEFNLILVVHVGGSVV